MNIYSYFPKKAHKEIFTASQDEKLLVFSGVGNVSAKGYLVRSYIDFKKFKNIFWLVNDNKEIYEVQNNLQFWTDRPIVELDHLMEGNQDDYRVTETIIGISDDESRFYIINHKDTHLILPTHKELLEQGVLITDRQDVQAVEFFNQLIQMGYHPSADIVLKKGEYRRSGGVIKVFPTN